MPDSQETPPPPPRFRQLFLGYVTILNIFALMDSIFLAEDQDIALTITNELYAKLEILPGQ